jgi:glycosyltransferase involved in cell wall biosynthesis
VPDLAAVWRDAAVMLAPLRYSTGIQNKVLEAMAAGVPVVTTPPVAAAIGAEAGVHLRIGDTADALARAVAATLADAQGAAGQAARAREYVRANFTWDESVRRLESLAGFPASVSPESTA